jgi:hypothetical protein
MSSLRSLLLLALVLACATTVAAKRHSPHAHPHTATRVPSLADNDGRALEQMMAIREKAIANQKLNSEAGNQALDWV